MKLIKAVTTIGGMTLLSRVAGFIRDILTASVLGAGPVADAFFVALKLPNFFRRITAEGAFSAAFIPLFSGKLEKHGKDKALLFASNTQSMMLAILLPFSLLIVAAMPLVIKMIAPGFVGDDIRFDLAVDLSRITFPYIVLISVVALLGGMMNAFDRFAPFAVMPVFFNISLILSLLYIIAGGEVPTPAHALAIGVIGAGIMQVLWMIYHARKMQIIPRLIAPEINSDVKQVFKLMGPGIIGAGAAQINIFIDMILASLLPAGSISYLYYADRLYQFPLGLIGISVGMALLPVLSRKIKAKNFRKGSLLFREAFAMGWVLSMPAAFGLALLAEKIISVLFEYGAFTANDTLMSANALRAYSFALPAFIGIKILSSASYANKNTKTPVKYAVIGSIVNIVLSIVLLQYLQHVGIALATAIGAWVNFILLGISLIRKNPVVTVKLEDFKWLGTILFCSLFMASVLVISYAIWPESLMPKHRVAEFIQLSLNIIIGIVSYFFSVYLTGNKWLFKFLLQKRK